MKKIRSINQLRVEKKRIHRELEELENNMHEKWVELKQTLTTRSILKDAYISVLKNKTAKNLNGENILKSTVAYGFSLLFNKFAGKAEEKLAGIFKKNKNQPEPEG